MIDVVPQMKAWAPKTKKIGIATGGDVVRASARWMTVSMTRPMRMRSPSFTWRVIEP